ncbi:DNA adenine methylase [Candidatus Methylomirabilis oxygeniifera]|uniref:Site-specific DNA-methyltransferase (adenine-specific) n=1 Tax=Methylomirabilis oxygeniifera TaxID=671143 RepID=D5MLN4_METO1|nr:DNA adenine methylase [Candidatus Methylomirabilis oxyfera]
MPEPFLKWPGGKRWLVQQHATMFPSSYRRYIEPFLGGGAVFFYLLPTSAVLSDTNPDLINAYECLQQYPALVDRRLHLLQKQHSKELYYRIRATLPKNALERAVRFIYLNRTCFNGIYRVNRNGDFNVPIGSKTLVEYPEGYLQTLSGCLSKASLQAADFEDTINRAGKDDFVFVDPPYTVMHNNNNFIKYNDRLFLWSDQLRLASAIKRAASRGAKIMLSNADHHSVRELYREFGIHHRINRSSMLAAEASHRCQTTELLITTYPFPNDEQPRGPLR